MEDDAVVEALTGQLLDAGDVVRCQVGAQFDDHAAVLEVEIEGVFRIQGLGLPLSEDECGEQCRHENARPPQHAKHSDVPIPRTRP
ncbi:hypothetical protein D3C71_2083930 [compost metagenome]